MWFHVPGVPRAFSFSNNILRISRIRSAICFTFCFLQNYAPLFCNYKDKKKSLLVLDVMPRLHVRSFWFFVLCHFVAIYFPTGLNNIFVAKQPQEAGNITSVNWPQKICYTAVDLSQFVFSKLLTIRIGVVGCLAQWQRCDTRGWVSLTTWSAL